MWTFSILFVSGLYCRMVMLQHDHKGGGGDPVTLKLARQGWKTKRTARSRCPQ
jgi:hypothetical protein